MAPPGRMSGATEAAGRRSLNTKQCVKTSAQMHTLGSPMMITILPLCLITADPLALGSIAARSSDCERWQLGWWGACERIGVEEQAPIVAP